jgi:L-ribulose-5-phosphate 3-epimerase
VKAAINHWAFPGEMPTTEAMDIAKSIGFEGFEIAVGEGTQIPLDATEQDVMAVRKHAEDIGISITSLACGLGWKYPLSSCDASVREQGQEVVRKSLQIGEWLGIDAMLIVPGVCDEQTPYDVALENALAGVQALVPDAEKHKVALCVENVWNKLLLSPVETRDFVDQCESEYVGVYFDTGNIILYGYPEQWISILGRRIRMVHVKDFRRDAGDFAGFVMLMEGDVNWPAVMQALRDVGYDKALVAEFGPYAHSRDVMLQHVRASLSAICAM